MYVFPYVTLCVYTDMYVYMYACHGAVDLGEAVFRSKRQTERMLKLNAYQ